MLKRRRPEGVPLAAGVLCGSYDRELETYIIFDIAQKLVTTGISAVTTVLLGARGNLRARAGPG
jgi:hypothetical protein